MDQENAPFSEFSNVIFDPLEAVSQAQAQLDFELAAKMESHLHKSREVEKSAEDAAGRQYAQKLSREEEDALLAVRLQQEEEAADLERRRRLALTEARDRKLVRQLSKEELREAERARKEAARIAKRDARVAEKLQDKVNKELEQEEREARWEDPVIHYEECKSFLRFWLKLPGMERGEVVISHESTGVALNIRARPKKKAVATTDFEAKVRLTTDAKSPIQLTEEDIKLIYHKSSHVLEIRCYRLMLQPTLRERMMSKLKSVFSSKQLRDA